MKFIFLAFCPLLAVNILQAQQITLRASAGLALASGQLTNVGSVKLNNRPTFCFWPSVSISENFSVGVASSIYFIDRGPHTEYLSTQEFTVKGSSYSIIATTSYDFNNKPSDLGVIGSGGIGYFNKVQDRIYKDGLGRDYIIEDRGNTVIFLINIAPYLYITNKVGIILDAGFFFATGNSGAYAFTVIPLQIGCTMKL